MARGTARSYFWVLWEWVASLGTLLWISLVERLFFFTRAEEGCEQRYSADYRCRERQWKTHGDQIRTLFIEVYSSLHRHVGVERGPCTLLESEFPKVLCFSIFFLQQIVLFFSSSFRFGLEGELWNSDVGFFDLKTKFRIEW